MWNTGDFASELLGTAFLVAGVIASITLTKKFKLDGLVALLFGALFCGASLLGGVAVGETHIHGGHGYGFVNPGVAFMWAIGQGNWDAFFPSLVGEIVGALVIAVLFVALAKVFKKDLPHLTSAFGVETKINFTKNTIGEVIGTTLFFGGVALVALGHLTGDGLLIAATVGGSLVIGIVASSSFGSVLNGAVGLALLLVRTVLNGSKGWNISLGNYANGFAVNLATAAVIGGIFQAV